MGVFRFLIPRRDILPNAAIATAYMSAHDDLPWVGEVNLVDDVLTLEREENDSGVFNILWPVEGHGVLLLSTSTLMERPAPYKLPLELARGMLNRLRNHVAAWEMAGVPMPPELQQPLRDALHHLVAAGTHQDSTDQMLDHSQQSLQASLLGIGSLASTIAHRLLAIRQRNSKGVPLLGARLGNAIPPEAAAQPLTAALNSALVPFTWSQIEAHEGRREWSIPDAQIQWCLRQGLRIGGGPLVEFDRRSLPDWLYLWEGDFDNLLSVATDHIRTVTTRYRGKFAFWNVMAQMMTGETLGLNEEQKLRMAVRAIETVRQTDPKTPVILSFDQPCAEHMSRSYIDLAPWHFADTLARGEIGLAGIGLELTVGYGENDTLPRDALELGRHVDRWAGLGLPLVISLTIPSAGDGFTPERQQQLLDAYAPVLLGRPAIQAVFWNQLADTAAQLSDTSPSTDRADSASPLSSHAHYLHSGLLDAAGKPKPALALLATLRKQFSA